jgi:hypothetical protein
MTYACVIRARTRANYLTSNRPAINVSNVFLILIIHLITYISWLHKTARKFAVRIYSAFLYKYTVLDLFNRLHILCKSQLTKGK